MSNKEWTEESGWYEPLKREESAPGIPARKKKHRGWTPWRVLGVIGLVVLLILGSSVAFAMPYSSEELLNGNRSKIDTPAPKGDEPRQDSDSGSMPKDWTEFFENYYETVQVDATDIGIERAELPIDFALELREDEGEELSLQELYSPVIIILLRHKGSFCNHITGFCLRYRRRCLLRLL